MLNASDEKTVISLRTLRDVVRDGFRPIVFWVGAGASKWAGYQSWKELALAIRKDFSLNVAGFDNTKALELLDKADFPGVFQICKRINQARYHSFIAKTFVPRPSTNVYTRFVELLSEIKPLFIVTTNVDEQLESNLPQCITVQSSDLSRCVDLLAAKTCFVAKLHGTVSAIASTVFASDEYDALLHNESYQDSLRYIFMGCTVVFIGYSVRDDYVIKLLNHNAKTQSLFGPGPHFVVTNDQVSVDSLVVFVMTLSFTLTTRRL
jgi:hypothetical protein